MQLVVTDKQQLIAALRAMPTDVPVSITVDMGARRSTYFFDYSKKKKGHVHEVRSFEWENVYATAEQIEKRIELIANRVNRIPARFFCAPPTREAIHKPLPRRPQLRLPLPSVLADAGGRP